MKSMKSMTTLKRTYRIGNTRPQKPRFLLYRAMPSARPHLPSSEARAGSALERTVAPSDTRDDPVRITIVPQEDGTFGIEASDAESSEYLGSFDTLAEAEGWIAKLRSSTD